METMIIRLLMILHLISRSSLLMVNGLNTTFYVNVALGKRALQSSTYVGQVRWGDTDMFHYDASLAVDGKVETNFRNNSCSSTDGGQSSAFWEVDLANLYYITTIKIYQRSDGNTDRNVGSTLSGKLQNDSYEVLTTLDRSNVFTFNTESSNMFKGIRINHNGVTDIFICLCEVQVFAVNVALGKRAWQSSTFVGESRWNDTDMFRYDASLAVDGNVETNFGNNKCSNTAAGYRIASWEVDLANLYYITTIKIYQRSDAFIDRNVGSVVSGKMQDDSYEYLTTLDRSGVFIFNTNSSYIFKGIRLIHSGASDAFICLCEVQVFVAITCNMPQLNRTMGTYTCSKLVGRACAYHSILTIHCNTGYRLSGFNSSQCIDTNGWSRNIGVCEAITCNMPQLNRTMGTYTCSKLDGRACTYHSILTIHCNTGYRLSGFNSSQCIDTDGWSRNIGVCEDIDECTQQGRSPCSNNGNCNNNIGSFSCACKSGYEGPICAMIVRCIDPVGEQKNGAIAYQSGIKGNLTYNSTVSIRCQEGYNLIGADHVRCTAESRWDGNLGHCSVVRCVDESLQRNNSVLLYQSGVEGNLTYNATVYIGCQVGYNLTGKDLVRCNAFRHWDGTLGNCSVVRCVDESLQRNNGVLLYQSGVEGNLTYNATVYIGCQVGYNLTGKDLVRCNALSHWDGTLGNCSVTRCTEIVPPEYGVIVVEAGTGGRWSFNTTVVIICNTGYNLNGETLIKCLETGRWTNALGYCLALPEKNADEEECKTKLLGWVITGPFCLILLVTNIATCLRFRRHKNSYMQAINNKSNELDNNAMEPYDNLQMGQIAKSEYDQLAFKRESSLKTTMKNEI